VALERLHLEVGGRHPARPAAADAGERAELDGHHARQVRRVDRLGEGERDRFHPLEAERVVGRDGVGGRRHERREPDLRLARRPREARERRPRLRGPELEGARVEPGERARVRRRERHQTLGVVLGAALRGPHVLREEDRDRVPAAEEVIRDDDRAGRGGRSRRRGRHGLRGGGRGEQREEKQQHHGGTAPAIDMYSRTTSSGGPVPGSSMPASAGRTATGPTSGGAPSANRYVPGWSVGICTTPVPSRFPCASRSVHETTSGLARTPTPTGPSRVTVNEKSAVAPAGRRRSGPSPSPIFVTRDAVTSAVPQSVPPPRARRPSYTGSPAT